VATPFWICSVQAARAVALGTDVGVALENQVGPLYGQVVNFLDDAAQGTAIYSASLSSQPSHLPFRINSFCPNARRWRGSYHVNVVPVTY
jgi:hypothetical protein